MRWRQSVDQALCFGWINDIRKNIDNDRYFIRFTPRKPTNTWSAVNIKKVEEIANLKRLNKLITDSEAGRKIKQLSYRE